MRPIPATSCSRAKRPTDCAETFSSWHGTSVAGIIGANTNDGVWTAGIDWAARILPVRVLGKCGGYDSDIVDGIAWAAGLAVPGMPANPTPAQVINMSLGGEGSVSADLSASVVAAAYAQRRHARDRCRRRQRVGRRREPVAGELSAASIAVASTTLAGKLASYSNFGAGITLSAPGGTSIRACRHRQHLRAVQRRDDDARAGCDHRTSAARASRRRWCRARSR